MPLSNTSDPVIREIRRLRRDYRILMGATFLLFVTLIIAGAASLLIRGHDLENLAKQSNEATVKTCFRQANQRPELRALTRDTSLSFAVQGFILGIFTNTPTLKECHKLASDLGVEIPEELK